MCNWHGHRHPQMLYFWPAQLSISINGEETNSGWKSKIRPVLFHSWAVFLLHRTWRYFPFLPVQCALCQTVLRISCVFAFLWLLKNSICWRRQNQDHKLQYLMLLGQTLKQEINLRLATIDRVWWSPLPSPQLEASLNPFHRWLQRHILKIHIEHIRQSNYQV